MISLISTPNDQISSRATERSACYADSPHMLANHRADADREAAAIAHRAIGKLASPDSTRIEPRQDAQKHTRPSDLNTNARIRAPVRGHQATLVCMELTRDGDGWRRTSLTSRGRQGVCVPCVCPLAKCSMIPLLPVTV
jgi:hypothetical protein